MSEYVYAGLTSQTIDIFLADSSSTTGGGLTGLAYNTASLTAYYRKGATGTATAITLATQTVGGAYSSGGFVQIDSTNMPGVYRLDLPNAMVDTEGFVTLYIRGATNLVPTALRIDCRPLPVDVKKYGGTPGTFSSGRPEVNTTHWGGTAVASANVLIDGAITESKIAADAITDNKVASDVTIASVTGAVGSVTSGVTLAATTHSGAVIPTVTTLTYLPSITTDWLTAAGLASDAVSKIQSGLATSTALASVKTDTTTLLNRITSTLFSGITYLSKWLGALAGKTSDSSTLTEIQATTAGATYSNITDSQEAIRDRGDAAWAGGGGSTVQINPIAIMTSSVQEQFIETHQNEYGTKGILFYDVDANGVKTAKDFSSFANLRWAFDLPDGTVWIETADITVSSNMLTIPVGDLTSDLGQYDSTLWDWAGAGATDERQVVLCCQLLVNEGVGADAVV